MKNSFGFLRFLCLTVAFLCFSGYAYSSDKPFVVVIDAGHGGKDAGAIGYTLKLQEKSVNLKTALKLGALLEKEPGVKVIYTRKKDVFIPLDDRAQIANRAKADLFISIHTNAAENRSAKGTETFTVGSSSANLEVAMRENSVILYESDYKTKYKGFDNSSESYIMFDYIQSKYIEQSVGFASTIEKQFSDMKRSSRGVKQAGFWVLKQTSMPAVLVELGYISNKEEEAYLSKDSSLDKFAEALHKAFVSYKKKHDKKDGTTYQEEVKKNLANDGGGQSEATKKDKDTSIVKVDTTKSEQKVDDGKNETDKKVDVIRYAVQFCSSSTRKPLDCKDFKGFVPAKEYVETGTYKYKYVYGSEKTFQDGLKLRDEVKKKFPDAFLVVIKNGVKLSTSEARNYYK